MPKEKTLTFKSLFLPFTIQKAIIFIFIIGLIVFCNSLFNDFVGDDKPLITANPVVQSLQNLPRFFTESDLYAGEGHKLEGFSYRPLQTTTFSIIYTLFGPNYFAFRLFQLFLYIINACILLLLLKKYFKLSLAFLLSVIFLIHPINSETVMSVAAMEDVLFLFFGITSLWILQNHQSKKAFLIAFLLLFLSLLSKEAGILFLFLNMLYVLIFRQKRLLLWLGYSALAFISYLALRISAIGIFPDSSVLAPIHDLSLQARLINIPAIFIFYIKTFLFPLDLAMSYHWIITKIDLVHFFLPMILDLLFLSVIFSFAIIIYKIFPRKLFTLFLFFALWFLLGMLLNLQIIPLDLTVSERWFYFPIIGLLGMIGVTLEAFNVNFVGHKWLTAFIVILLVILSFRTFNRSFDWRNEMTLADHDLNVSKEAYNLELILSGVYFNQGRFNDAVTHAQRSIHLYPNVVNYGILGLSYFNLGDYRKAKEAYMQSLRFKEFDAIYENLAAIAFYYGNPDRNINFIRNVGLRKYPNDWKLWYSLAVLEYNYGSKQSAKTEIEQAHRLVHDQQVTAVYYLIINNKPLNIKLKQ